jgi:hypothetical protein
MALQTVSILTLSQPDTATAKVNFNGTIADADNDVLSVAYQWKLSTDADWKLATTSGPSSITAVAGGTPIAGVWDVDADYSGSLQTATLQLRAVATKAAAPAAGTLTAVAANAATGIKDGDTFVLGGVTFEFTTDGQPATAGRTAVGLSSPTALVAAVKTAIINAINNSAATVSATSGSGNVINLAAKEGGVAGNVSITETFANAGVTLTPVGMTGGVDAQVVNGTNASLAAAATGTVGEASTTLVDPHPQKNVVDFYPLEQLGVYGKGVMAQAYFKGKVVYKAIDLLRAGTRAKFDIEADRAGLKLRRAVLISVSEWNRVRGSASLTIELKSKQWLANTAWRALSVPEVFGANGENVYALFESKIVAGQSIQTIVAYLVSGEKYAELAN